MKDEQFGDLKWDADDCRWEGKATFPYLRGFGHTLDLEDGEDPTPAAEPERGPTKGQLEARAQIEQMAQNAASPEEAALLNLALGFADRMREARETAAAAPREKEAPSEEELQLRQGVCDLAIETAGKRSKPSKAQRAAWAALQARGDAIWDDVAAAALSAYRRQRPMRVKFWRRVYGEHLLDHRLPDVNDVEAMKQLIRPGVVRVRHADKGADVAVHATATWCVDGVGVVIRDGRVVDVGEPMDVVYAAPKPREAIEHPVFGTLRRIPDDDPFEVIDQWQTPTEEGKSGFENAKRGGPWPWEGRARFDGLLDFGYIADERARYAHDRADADRPESRMSWEFADGQFDLRVYAGRRRTPTDAQARAFEAFLAARDALADEMIRAVFDRYQASRDECRRNYKDRYLDENIPKIAGPEGLRDLMQLRHVHVYEPEADGQVRMGFQFVCTWNYDGFTAFWRDGKIVEWGTWSDARPK